MEYNQYGSGYNAQQYAYPPGYSAQYAQPQQQQQQPYQAASAPQIRNPFAPPPSAATGYGVNAGFDPDHEQQVAMWQAQYAPADQQAKKGGKNDRAENANTAPLGQRGSATGAGEGSTAQGANAVADSKLTVVRKGGGETWEDKSLLEWDPKQFRIMVGNLAGEVTDESLAKAFAAYGVAKARVIRDKRTTKSKGYGFVSFLEGETGFKAAREMVGKYIGSHPVTIQRSKANVAPVVKKDPRQNKGRNNKNNKDKNKDGKKEDGPLRANTGAGIEKKLPAKTATGLKLLG